MTILEEILENKRREVADAKVRVAPEGLRALARDRKDPPRGFRSVLASAPRPRIIAEIKRRSPSRGEIRVDFDPVACAKMYSDAGAAALSVLTDERYFGGRLEHLSRVRRAVPLPILRKDFVIDPYQIDEAAAAGADAVLLIVAALDSAELVSLREHAESLGLDAFVEVHDEHELDAALKSGADLLGINNRDLRSFEVDLGVTERLAPKVAGEGLVVAESGIFTHDQIRALERAGADAFLVGEALMREEDMCAALRLLRGTS
jgi:indole-3-glycerol phosphate synthase